MNEDAARMLMDHGKRISALETIEVSGAAGGGSAPDDAQYVVMALNAILTAERVLTAGDSISLADGGAGGNATIALTIPGTLTVATANNAVGPHLHTITSSSNPGAAASILATDANGYLQLVGLGIGAVPGSADLHFATGRGITHVDGIAAGQFLRANGVRYVPDTLDVADLTDLAYAAPNLTLGLANAVGAANTVIRTDATILAFDAVVPDVIQCDDAAAAGAAAVAARRDHAHGIVCAAPPRLVPDNAQAEGSATSFARSDHDHQITCAAPGANLSVSSANAEGVAANDFARSDHSHAITSSSNPGAAASILASDASGYLRLTGMGIGIAPNAHQPLKISFQAVAPTGAYYGIFNDHRITDASGATSSVYGLYNSVVVDDAGQAVGALYGADFYTALGEGTCSSLTTLRARAYWSPGTVTNDLKALSATVSDNLGTVSGDVYGAEITVDTGSTISGDLYGTYIRVNDTAAVGTSYVLYLAAINADYGIYQSGGADNYFSGDVGIGALAPARTLQVLGDTKNIGLSSADFELAYLGAHGGGANLDRGFLWLLDTGVTDVQISTLSTAPTFFNHGGNIGFNTIAPGSITEWNMADEDLEFVDAHVAVSVATVEAVVEVITPTRGTGYLAIYSSYGV